MARDPYSTHAYRYAHANPLMYLDADGRKPLVWAAGVSTLADYGFLAADLYAFAQLPSWGGAGVVALDVVAVASPVVPNVWSPAAHGANALERVSDAVSAQRATTATTSAAEAAVSTVQGAARPGAATQLVDQASKGRATGARTLTGSDWDAAEAAYDVIRGTDDVATIAANTGMRPASVSQIKDHLFNRTHQLDDGVARFDADPFIANAWQRMQSGTHTPNDMRLLQHELFESKLEGIFRTDYRTAHDAAIRSGRTWEWTP